MGLGLVGTARRAGGRAALVLVAAVAAATAYTVPAAAGTTVAHPSDRSRPASTGQPPGRPRQGATGVADPWVGAFHPRGASPGVWALRRQPRPGVAALPPAQGRRLPVTPPRSSTSCAVPTAPGSPLATAGTNQAAVSWAAANGNGSAITAYVVREATGAQVGDSVATDGSATTATVTGLAAGTAATFSVAAESACGTGPAATTAAVTPTGAKSTYVGAVLAQTPSVFYRLADPSGSVMADSSGASSDGAYSGQESLGQPAPLASDPAPSAGYTTCCSGIGSGAPSLPQADSARSVEAWVETTNGNCCQALVTWGSPSTDEAFVVGLGPTYVTVDGWSDYLSFTTPRPIDDGAWHLLDVAFDGATVTVYLDGQEIGSSPFTGTLNTLGSSVSLANAPFGGYNQYGGNLADVAIYPAALTATQVAAHFQASGYSRPTAAHVVHAAYGGPNGADVSWGYATVKGTAVTAYVVTAVGTSGRGQSVSAPADATAAQLTGLAPGSYTFTVQAMDAYGDGPLAKTGSLTVTGSPTTYASTVLADRPSVFYRLADGATAAMADSSGHGATGAYFASNVALGQPAPLASDPAPSIGVNNNSIAGQAFPTTLPLYDSPRTMEGWINTTSNAQQYVASYGPSSTSEAFALGIQIYNQSNTMFVDGFNDTLTFNSPVSLDDGAWHMVAVTTNGTSATVYVDGRSLGTQQFPATLDTQLDANGLEVGATSWSCCQAPRGDEADVAVFPAALSAAQIAAQFAASGYAVPGAPGSVSAT
ncbi:MAG TPA: LamG-like jellyroll fold domain-containing protein, partial [Acidimicrobiales bacterium]|nr:LamG-like jellyroll fold domain-containing protein [Acidimicrobiales bacterium]